MPQLPVVFPAASVAGGRPAGAGSRFAVAYGQPGAGPGVRRAYRRGWRQFQQQNDPDGCILFDGGGIREENRKGKPTHFDWEDWDVAVVTPRVIVLTFRVPVLLFFPYTEEAAITVAHAARAFGKEDAVVYRQKI